MKVAIIGAGVTGAAAAARLCSCPGIEVEIFDQGRRGAGGRTSHRLVRLEDQAVLPDDGLPEDCEGLLAFDHGCQFFTARDPRFREMVDEWVAAGAAAVWDGRFDCVGADCRRSEAAAADFFGCCSGAPLYTGNGGMHRIARHMVNKAVAAGARFNRGVRVSGIRKAGAGNGRQWVLEGVGGEAAYHDTREEVAAAAEHGEICRADVVIVTDASCSFDGWHRASAGVAEAAPELASAVRSRARVPLFTAMAAFEQEVAAPLDAFVVAGRLGSPLWFAARTRSKPGLGMASKHDCWTLVSTPGFAAEEIRTTEMQDPVTGAFRPQENGYLNGKDGPSETLLQAFHEALQLAQGGKELCATIPNCVYLQGQRWGSAFPAPVSSCSIHDAGGSFFFRDTTSEAPAAASRKDIMGVLYETSTPRTAEAAITNYADTDNGDVQAEGGLDPALRDHGDRGFLADTNAGLYYAGDFCSTRMAGVEAAVMSGLHAAEHVASCS